MTVEEITKKYLKDNGFNGLCSPDYECSCSIDDFNCCGETFADCEPGYIIEDETEER